jgi:integrase
MSRSKLTPAEIAKRRREGRYHDGTKPLTAKRMQALKGEGRYHDADVRGLYLQISDRGARSWLLRYALNGQPERSMGLGSASEFSLKAARERAREARRLIADGIDPLTQRQAERAAQAAAAQKALTFAQAAETYFNQHQQKWSNREHRIEFLNSLQRYAFEKIGKMDVAMIATADVLRVLDPFWQKTPTTADRVRNRIENIIDWSVVRGHRPPGTNPAAWKGHLDQVLAAPRDLVKVKHHAALAYSEVPAFMATLRADATIPARALEFLILTAARSGEVLGARWSEIDLDGAVWVVPPERMKARIEHRVPLSDSAVALLRSLPTERDNPHVFIGRPLRGLGKDTFKYLLQRLGSGITTHGFRASFKTWASAETAFPREIIERSLAHTIGSKVEQSYERGDALQKRRALMTAWARYCSTPARAQASADVVPIGGRK